MEPAKRDFEIVRGATFRRQWLYAQPGATEENGWIPRYDFTGCEARMQIRAKPNVDPAWVTLSETATADGQIILGGTAGTVDVILTRTGSNKLPESDTVVRGYYDIFLEWPNPVDGDCIATGKFKIKPNTTEPQYD